MGGVPDTDTKHYRTGLNLIYARLLNRIDLHLFYKCSIFPNKKGQDEQIWDKPTGFERPCLHFYNCLYVHIVTILKIILKGRFILYTFYSYHLGLPSKRNIGTHFSFPFLSGSDSS